jgi:elongation factor P
MINATQIRKGMIILVDGDLYRVVDSTHITPGKGQALMQTKLRRLKDESIHDYRFRSKDRVEQAYLDSIEMEFLYHEGDDYIFMNLETYEQIRLAEEVLGDAVNYILPNIVISIEFYENQPVGVTPPQTVELEVVKTAPFLKGATAAAGNKPATLETGIVVNVPQFIKEGDKLKIDTRDGSYIERAK